MKALDKVNEILEYVSEQDFFMCETKIQARNMSEGFIKEVKSLKSMIEQLEREVLWQERRYEEAMKHKDEMAMEIQAARIYKESVEARDK